MFDMVDMADEKCRKNKIKPIFAISVAMLLTLSTFVMFVSSADDTPFDPFNPFPQGGGNIIAPEAYLTQGSPNIGYYSNQNVYNLRTFGYYNTTPAYLQSGNYTNINPRTISGSNWLYFWGRQYNHSNELGQIIPTYPNIIITKVYAIIIYPHHLKTGWFSVKVSSVDFNTATPWLSYGMYFSTSGAGVNTSYLFNSTLYPYQEIGGFPYNLGITEWDITSITNWTLSKITSINTYVMWTTIESQPISPGDYVDYIGLRWEYYATNWSYTGEQDLNLIPGFEDNFNSILWLLIVFAPALALQYMLPKIGYAFGMFISLFIFGLTEPNFMYVTIIGISALGVMLYKGD